MKQGQFPEILNLSDLNGQNGFKIDGENGGDCSGYTVSAAGDVNGDGNSDLLIGAPCYFVQSGKGRSYVVFGGPGVGSSGNILLSNLNGANGFKLDGENNPDNSGHYVSAGDINGDGYADLLIGAWGYADNQKGRSYVVFGGPGVSSSGDILLSSLNGTNGFKLDGEYNISRSGFSVSAVGDINGDGSNDLLIGAFGYPNGDNMGRSYVVFGGSEVGRSGDILLSNLTGANGFKLDGESIFGLSGYSVSAGDINGDGYADLLIGAWGYPGGDSKGRSYVVFGGPGVGTSGNILLSSLNGANGFKLDGENNGDCSAWHISAAGDMNGDHYTDLVVGAYGYPSGGNQGRSYVVFGGPGVGRSGNIALSSLTGANGFKLDGENNISYSGYSVSAAGDINGDGYADLIIGAAQYYGNQKGRSYVVFGGPGVGSNGLIALSSLNGTNGFKLEGENNADESGCSVSAAGDINGDGIADLLIGAYNYPNGISMGRSYVVFGDCPPQLINNTLSLYNGTVAVFNSTNLAAISFNHPNNSLIFIPTAITHGYFDSVSNPGIPLANFTQQWINQSMIRFVHDGSSQAPNYNITVRSSGIAWIGPISANIAFTVNNQNLTPTSIFIQTPTAQALLGGLLGGSGLLLLALIYKYKEKIRKKCFRHVNPALSMRAKIESSLITAHSSSGSESKQGHLPRSSSQEQKESITPDLAECATHSLDRVQNEDEKKYSVTQLNEPAEVPVLPDGQMEMARLPEENQACIVTVSFEIRSKDLNLDHETQLGKGAFGTVHPGTYNGESVAVKKLDAKTVNQKELQREAKTMVSVSAKSEHLVLLRGVCIKEHYFYLVMELMKGGSLYGLLKEKPKLPLVVIYKIALDVGRGLQTLHLNRIFHRDLKSMNVLLKYQYQEGNHGNLLAKISDFGLSKMKSEEAITCETKDPKGTLGWMAPELFNNPLPKADDATDIYAFGMILWELTPKSEYCVPFQGVKSEEMKNEKIKRGLEQEKIPARLSATI